MPRTNCQHCQKLFTLRAGATSAKVVCPFCRKSTSTTQPAPSAWYLAQGQERRGPFTWSELIDKATAGEIGVDDMLWHEGKTQWSLASTYLDLGVVEAQPEISREERELETQAPDIAAIQAQLRALSTRFDLDARRAARQAETSASEAAALARDSAAPLANTSHSDVPEPEAQASDSAPLLANTSRSDVPEPEAQVSDSATPVANISSSEVTGLSPAWQTARWLSTCATTFVAVCALVFWFRYGIEARQRMDIRPLERNAEEQQEPRAAERERDVLAIAAWSGELMDELNRCRKNAGLREVVLCPELSEACTEHAKYLARNVAPEKATPANVYREDPALPNFSAAGEKAAAVALVCYAEPMPALERWMGRLFSRVQFMDENLERLGLGFEQNAAGAWVCVANPVHGRGTVPAMAVVLYPAANQKDVPSVGFDVLDDVKGKTGFPISATFPRQAGLRNVQATLTDEKGKTIELRISSPESPRNEKLQRTTIGLHPITALQAGRTYTVVLIASVNGAAWRQSWQFTVKE